MVKLGKNHLYVQLTKNSVCCRPLPVFRQVLQGYEFKTTNIKFKPHETSATIGLIGTTNYGSDFFIREYWNFQDGTSIIFTIDNGGYLISSVSPVDGNWEAIYKLNINTINPVLLSSFLGKNDPISYTNDYYSSIDGMPGVKLNLIPETNPFSMVDM